MKNIKIRFLTERDFVSDSIRFVTHAPKYAPSHAEFELEDGTFLGAHDNGGVAIRPADYCTPTWERRYAIPVTDAQYDVVMTFAHAQIGKPYDFLDILGILGDRDWHTRERWICSELVFASCFAGGVFLLNALPNVSYRIDPDRLHLSPLLMNRCYLSTIDLPSDKVIA